MPPHDFLFNIFLSPISLYLKNFKVAIVPMKFNKTYKRVISKKSGLSKRNPTIAINKIDKVPKAFNASTLSYKVGPTKSLANTKIKEIKIAITAT